MGVPSIIAIYLTVWWTVLFAVLPWGVKSHAEAGVDPQGGDPGAPVNPNLKRKFITTSWVSAIIVAVLLLMIRFQVIDFAKLPWRTH
jgi:predicted secreted protein